ncbi:PLD nuclease N-terminal domain-containing protein [Demequina maris]|uniref:PLD nuclease N-terminal domain-containing protein n=1 Tax=Demequina maris TaxID=1638982 RepID=UPI000780DC8D|nr:PLD nuclease N-terminal domain-containing protein [Demequina maris]
MARVLPLLVYLGLVIYALSDAMQRPEKDPYGVSKWLWAAIIVLLPYVGAIGWILLSRTRPDSGPQRRSEPVAPDDDPEYLAWLREQSRRKRQSGEGR